MQAVTPTRMNANRRLTLLDKLLIQVDHGLRAVTGQAAGAGRANPANALPDEGGDEAGRRRSAGLMRVNHAGEVAAQALYRGQALAARGSRVRDTLIRGAAEESDHLAWCRERLAELGARTSRLDPVWYTGSFAIGVVVGLAGDRWSMGFVAETERQVVAHLDRHLKALPPGDRRSRAIVQQMQLDEGRHATVALEAGASDLPPPVKQAMRLTARIMTTTAYWV